MALLYMIPYHYITSMVLIACKLELITILIALLILLLLLRVLFFLEPTIDVVYKRPRTNEVCKEKENIYRYVIYQFTKILATAS